MPFDENGDEYILFHQADSWDNPPESDPWDDIRKAYSQMVDGAILFGFAHTPDGSPFHAFPNNEGVYVITDAQEPAHAQDSHRGDQDLRKSLPGVQGDLDL